MIAQGKRKRLFSRCVLVVGILASCGWSPFRQLPPPPAEVVAQSHALSPEQRAHVHIFMINGLTVVPHVYGSLNGISDYITCLGLNKPSVATHYYRWRFQKRIRQIYQHDPEARIVLVGYSIGGGVVHAMAKTLAEEGIPIALIVYIDPHSFRHDLDRPPCNVLRTVNIFSHGPLLHSDVMPEADNLEVEDSWHLGLPKHRATLEALARELVGVACAAPRSGCSSASPPVIESVPTPEPASR